MIKKFFVAFSLLALLGLGPAHGQGERVTVDGLIKQFNAVVFLHEHGQTGREAKPLVKWQGPVVLGLSGTLKKEQLQELLDVLNRIQKLTGLEIRNAKKGERPNFMVSFKPRDVLAKELKHGINCQGTLSGNSDFHITRARALIPSDHPQKTSHCIVEEVVQLFGLTNDSTLMSNSIFHEDSIRLSMSVSDQILLMALYDKRLRPGLTQAEAQPVLREVIKDILLKAQSRKNSGGL